MDNDDQIVESLILQGGLEVAAIDIETGEALYTFTDKLQQINPELHSAAQNYFYLEMMNLWEKGFLDIDLESDDPVVSITDKALDENERESLDKHSKQSLYQVMKATNKEK
jgi:hypothetical protein